MSFDSVVVRVYIVYDGGFLLLRTIVTRIFYVPRCGQERTSPL